MPAEWEPHEATWIAWPHNANDWPGRFAPIPWVYAEIVRKLSRVEKVRILVAGAAEEARARGVLRKASAAMEAVEFFPCSTNRVWTRDFGPIFVKDRRGEVALTGWRFNAWAKYDDWRKDVLVPGTLAKHLGLTLFQPEMVLEGGSIDVNGAGLLLSTEECLLSEVQQRNPGVSREQLERAFHEYLGIDQVIWLNRGIVGDDTHGHIDDIARFVTPTTIVAAVEPNTHDPNHATLVDNLARLKVARTLDGKQFELVELPMPRPVIFRGQRLPASYANFYIANGLVLVPTFHDANDRVVLNILADVFPGREVIGIHSVDLVWGLGTLHCMTQQQPEAV